jgi:hypothetical protein
VEDAVILRRTEPAAVNPRSKLRRESSCD